MATLRPTSAPGDQGRSICCVFVRKQSRPCRPHDDRLAEINRSRRRGMRRSRCSTCSRRNAPTCSIRYARWPTPATIFAFTTVDWWRHSCSAAGLLARFNPPSWKSCAHRAGWIACCRAAQKRGAGTCWSRCTAISRWRPSRISGRSSKRIPAGHEKGGKRRQHSWQELGPARKSCSIVRGSATEADPVLAQDPAVIRNMPDKCASKLRSNRL